MEVCEEEEVDLSANSFGACKLLQVQLFLQRGRWPDWGGSFLVDRWMRGFSRPSEEGTGWARCGNSSAALINRVFSKG